ncbi:hypothetical protein [Desulfosarcina ovata]
MLDLALLSVAVVDAIFGFLRFNAHPAIIFMGDALKGRDRSATV